MIWIATLGIAGAIMIGCGITVELLRKSRNTITGWSQQSITERNQLGKKIDVAVRAGAMATCVFVQSLSRIFYANGSISEKSFEAFNWTSLAGTFICIVLIVHAISRKHR